MLERTTGSLCDDGRVTVTNGEGEEETQNNDMKIYICVGGCREGSFDVVVFVRDRSVDVVARRLTVPSHRLVVFIPYDPKLNQMTVMSKFFRFRAIILGPIRPVHRYVVTVPFYLVLRLTALKQRYLSIHVFVLVPTDPWIHRF